MAPWLKFSGNLDLNNADGGRIHVLDAVAQFEPTPLFNVDAGLNYVLDGHNARAGLAVQTTNPAVGSTYTGVQLGIQIQE